MLKQLRQKKVMKKILWVLALIIIPAFVLWGAGGLRESKNYVGMLFGKKITFDEYRDAFTATRNQALLTYGSNFHRIQDKLNLEGAAWDHLIMLKEARHKRIKVSDREVIARIASMPVFQHKDGTFSQRTYTMLLNSALRTDPRKFEEETRQSLIIEKLIQEVIKDVAGPSETEIEEALKIGPEEKKEEGEEEKEETPEQKRMRIKSALFLTKRIEVIQNWRADLYKKANFISYLKKEEEETEEAEEEKELFQ